MRQNETVTLERAELESVFGPLSSRKAWHRLEERLSRCGRLGRARGVRFSARRGDFLVTVAARESAQLRAFCRLLRERGGPVQRGLAEALERKSQGQATPADWAAFWQRQRGLCRPAPVAGLPFAWVEPPFSVEGRAGAGGACARLEAGEAWAVVGEAGAGKTALLWRAFESACGRLPLAVWLPARRLRLGGAGLVDWGSVPGCAGLESALERALAQGRLALFLDGLEEAATLLDLRREESARFWEAALRGRCLVSCRASVFERRVFRSPWHGLAGPRLSILRLRGWDAESTRALYVRLYREKGVERLAALSRLGDSELESRLGAPIAPAAAWAVAASAAGSGAACGEYVAMNAAFERLLETERGRGGLSAGALEGALERLAWRAYARDLGARLRVSAAELDAVATESPFLLGRRDELFEALLGFPWLDYDEREGAFAFRPVFAFFLGARRLLRLAAGGDAEALRLALRTPLSSEISRPLYQGLAAAGEKERRAVLRAAQEAFALARALCAREPDDAGHATSLQALLQPVGRLGLPEAADFLRAVLAEADSLPELVAHSCARALAYAGDETAVEACLERLRRNARAREVNCNFYLFWQKDGRATRSGRDWLLELRVDAGWERTCRWFLEELSRREFLALRPIHLFTFCDLIESLGRPPAPPEALAELARRLEREVASGPASLACQFKRLRRLLGVSRAGRAAPSETHERVSRS